MKAQFSIEAHYKGTIIPVTPKTPGTTLVEGLRYITKMTDLSNLGHRVIENKRNKLINPKSHPRKEERITYVVPIIQSLLQSLLPSQFLSLTNRLSPFLYFFCNKMDVWPLSSSTRANMNAVLADR